MRQEEIQRYEKMLTQDPNSRAFAPLAEAYRKAGDLDMALSIAQSGLEIHPDYVGGLVVEGRVLFEKGEYKKAMEALSKAVADAPENYRAQKCLAKTAMALKDNETALAALRAAALLSPEDEEVVKDLEKLEAQVSAAAFQPVPEMEIEDMLKMSEDSLPEPAASPPLAGEPETVPSYSSPGTPGGQPAEALAPLSEGLGFADESYEPGEETASEPGSPVAGGVSDGFEQFPPSEIPGEPDKSEPEGFSLDADDELESFLPDSSPTSEQDVITTETLADIYADQGQAEKAEELYSRLKQDESVPEAATGTIDPGPEQARELDGAGETGSLQDVQVERNSSEGTDNVNATLESWLLNVERMRRK